VLRSGTPLLLTLVALRLVTLGAVVSTEKNGASPNGLSLALLECY
jgi:hypothetical protein